MKKFTLLLLLVVCFPLALTGCGSTVDDRDDPLSGYSVGSLLPFGTRGMWVCNFHADECKQFFNLPDNEEPAVLIPIGYAADELREKIRKDMSEITCV